MDTWVARLCAVPIRFREGHSSLIGVFIEADPQTDDRASFLSTVTGYLQQHRELIREWSHYSQDKRVDSGAYLKLGEPSEVGVYSDGRLHEVRRYDDSADACADFLWREVSMMRASSNWPHD